MKEAQHRFFDTLSHYSRQFLDLGARPNVKSITGLSPAISLAQFETKASVRATVGSLTDISELFGILYSQFADIFCPKHNLSTQRLDENSITERVLQSHKDQPILICAPLIEDKKGNYRKLLNRFAEKGFLKAFIDGKIQGLTPIPELEQEKKHTIKLVVDQLTPKADKLSRLKRSIATAIEASDGYVECLPIQGKQTILNQLKSTYSNKGSCPTCGYSAPRLDTRYFSANSLGKCTSCNGLGVSDISLEIHDEDPSPEIEETFLENSMKACQKCSGTGFNSELKHIRLGPHSTLDIHMMSLKRLRSFLETCTQPQPAFARVRAEIVERLVKLEQLGLGYLNLGRRILSLSGGEHGRLKLAGILSESLRGVLYILDEPSQGLHPDEITTLVENLEQLKQQGNTLIIVDHDQDLIKQADWIVELGREVEQKVEASLVNLNLRKLRKCSTNRQQQSFFVRRIVHQRPGQRRK